MIKVVIIEDEVNAAKYCASYIESYGHQFVVSAICRNAAEARVVLSKGMPEVIFCDIRLGKDNGLELMEEFRRSGWSGHIVIMSGYRDFNYVRKAIHLAATDYLVKPVFPEDVEKVLASIAAKIGKGTASIESLLIKSSRNSMPPFILKALDYVTLNYIDQINLKDVAPYACVSVAYLSAGFRKYTGYTFIEYLNMYRIEVAKKLLLETNQPMEQIALQVGIGDVIYFNKLFKRFSRQSPGKFRRDFGGSGKVAEGRQEN